MIIKVISYFDVQGVIPQGDLPDFVEELTDKVYKSLRKDSFSTMTFSISLKKRVKLSEVDLKVVSREKALEHLRTSS